MFKSKVVKPKQGHKYGGKASDWNVVLTFDWRDIPNDLPLTTRAYNRWKNKHRSPFHYVTFKTLRHNDIVSVLSNAKHNRGVMLQIDRQGRTAFYKVNQTKGG